MKKAFTLAEIIIVLSIIGLVADMTLPALISNVNEKVLKTSKQIASLKFEEAMNEMLVNDKLTGYATADAFVDEFKKYVKTVNRCAPSNIEKCFINKIKTATEEVETKKLKTGANIAILNSQNYPSNNVGITLPNGIMAIINYDKTCQWLNPLAGGGANRVEATKCLSMIYDVNGRKKPNKVGEDIVTLNAKVSSGFDCIKIGSICISTSDVPFSPIKESCPPLSGGKDWCAGGDKNYWAGARNACRIAGGRLLSNSEIFIPDVRRYFKNGLTGSYWAGELGSGLDSAMFINANDLTTGGYGKNVNLCKLRCVR